MMLDASMALLPLLVLCTVQHTAATTVQLNSGWTMCPHGVDPAAASTAAGFGSTSSDSKVKFTGLTQNSQVDPAV
jgi:hypothetical protein